MAVLDDDDETARLLLADLNRTQLEAVAISAAAFAIEIVATDEREEFRTEVAREALEMTRWERLEP
jgi:hypothetical protein